MHSPEPFMRDQHTEDSKLVQGQEAAAYAEVAGELDQAAQPDTGNSPAPAPTLTAAPDSAHVLRERYAEAMSIIASLKALTIRVKGSSADPFRGGNEALIDDTGITKAEAAMERLLDLLLTMGITGMRVQYDAKRVIRLEESGKAKGKETKDRTFYVETGSSLRPKSVALVSNEPAGYELSGEALQAIDDVPELASLDTADFAEAARSSNEKEKAQLTQKAKRLRRIKLMATLAQICLEKRGVQPKAYQRPGVRRALSIVGVALTTAVAALAVGAGFKTELKGAATMALEPATAEKFDEKEYAKGKAELKRIDAELKMIPERGNQLLREWKDQPEWQLALLETMEEVDEGNLQYMTSERVQLAAIPKLKLTSGTSPIDMLKHCTTAKAHEQLTARYLATSDPKIITNLVAQLQLTDDAITAILQKAPRLDSDVFQYLKNPRDQMVAVSKFAQAEWTGVKTHRTHEYKYRTGHEPLEPPLRYDDGVTLIKYLEGFHVGENVKKAIVENAIKSEGFNTDLFSLVSEPQQQIAVLKGMATKLEVFNHDTVANLLRYAANDGVKAEIIKTVLSFKSHDFIVFRDLSTETDQIKFLSKLNVSDVEARASGFIAVRNLPRVANYSFDDDANSAYDFLIKHALSQKVKDAIRRKWGR